MHAGEGSKRTPLRRFARREDLALAPAEFALLQRLSTPQKIQSFINAVPINHELNGETIHSVRSVIRQRRAHCIEGAMFAACALWVHGEPPLVMHLDCSLSDYPHVVALFRRGEDWAVFLVEAGRARVQAVQLGQRNDRDGQILNGLSEGQTIVLHPPDTLTDGARVRVRGG